MNAKLMTGVIILGIVIAALFLFTCKDDWCMLFAWQKAQVVNSFDDCVRLGFLVSESYPPQCRAGSKSFTKNVGNELDKVDLIRINWPRPGSTVKAGTPLLVKGEARGNWFFEASFPIVLKDANGTLLAQGIAQAEGEWMTTEFVPFVSTLSFSGTPATKDGTLTLQKDNPSGMPEHDDALVIPLTFE
ncbi:MAG: Gmad2 immunoglobulin-like domain-containing protein [Patescibacteria group bacterium]